MDVELRTVEFTTISKYMRDFQQKSRSFEMPPDEAEYIGVFKGQDLIGYFILVHYENGVLEINQGYLRPEYRHTNLSKDSMSVLEQAAKQAGKKKIVLGTYRASSSYIKFMKNLGYQIISVDFAKEI